MDGRAAANLPRVPAKSEMHTRIRANVKGSNHGSDTAEGRMQVEPSSPEIWCIWGKRPEMSFPCAAPVTVMSRPGTGVSAQAEFMRPICVAGCNLARSEAARLPAAIVGRPRSAARRSPGHPRNWRQKRRRNRGGTYSILAHWFPAASGCKPAIPPWNISTASWWNRAGRACTPMSLDGAWIVAVEPQQLPRLREDRHRDVRIRQNAFRPN